MAKVTEKHISIWVSRVERRIQCSDPGCSEIAPYRGATIDKWASRDWYCAKHGGENRNRGRVGKMYSPGRDWWVFWAHTHHKMTLRSIADTLGLSYGRVNEIWRQKLRIADIAQSSNDAKRRVHMEQKIKNGMVLAEKFQKMLDAVK